MDRRSVLKTVANSTVTSSTAKQKRMLSTGLSPYQGPWGFDEANHLLKRSVYGASYQQVTQLAALGRQAAVNGLLSNIQQPDPPVNNYNTRNIIDPAVPVGQTWVNAPLDFNVNFLRVNSFKNWWTKNISTRNQHLGEKMAMFWHNHFATEANIIQHAQILYWHHALLRQHALGNFRTLLIEVTKDAGMLIYLNGFQNSKGAPDENYARELQELFTVGKGGGSAYTEADVKAAARVLTGWRVERNGINGYFEPNRHDTGDKTFSAFYNNKVIKGKIGAAGADEMVELIDMILEKDEVAKHVCRRLYRYFVYYDIDAFTEHAVIEPLADIFRNSGYEIKPVVEALLNSEHFFDVQNRGCYIKTPHEFLAGLVNQYQIQIPASLEEETTFFNGMRNFGLILQEDLGDPPNVAGWPAFHQAPNYYQLWINSDTLPKRNQFSDLMTFVGFRIGGNNIQIDALKFAESIPNVSDINLFIDNIIKFLYQVEVSQTLKDYLKSILLSNQSQDYYWTQVWTTYKVNPTDTANTNYVNLVLRSMLKYLMNLAEYQLN